MPDAWQVVPNVFAEERLHDNEQGDFASLDQHVHDLTIAPLRGNALGLADHHFGVGGQLRGVKQRLHQAAVAVVFFAVHDEDAAPQQVGDGVGVAPEKFVALGDKDFAIRFRTEDDIRTETGQGNLKEAPEVFRHDFERSERGAFGEERAQGRESHRGGELKRWGRSHRFSSSSNSSNSELGGMSAIE